MNLIEGEFYNFDGEHDRMEYVGIGFDTNYARKSLIFKPEESEFYVILEIEDLEFIDDSEPIYN